MLKRLICFITVLACVFGMIKVSYYYLNMQGEIGETSSSFSGKGTKNCPYVIRDVNDLLVLEQNVNAGEDYSGKYFVQEEDINLEGIEWIPIGLYGSNNYFDGIYDGNNHVVYNLNISSNSTEGNVGFFGVLQGVILNFGIESGDIYGDYVGAIASAGIGDSSAIINCYNKATVHANKRGGGIADNFSSGRIINCANMGKIIAPVSGEIVSYSSQLIVNTYPDQDAVNSFFSGNRIEYGINLEGKDFLNAGIQYFEDHKMFLDSGITKWRN